VSREIVDTGLGGGCLFEIVYEQDRLAAAKGPPRRYQRCDILTEDKIVGGVIVQVAVPVIDGQEVPNTYALQIASDVAGARAVASAVADGTVAVRVLG
jgi:hypothetical protein